MEAFKRDTTADDLQSFDPQDWPNIPRPIIITFALIRKALLNHENGISKLKQSIHHVDVKGETHYNELVKTISNTNDMIVSSEEICKDFTEQKYEKVKKKFEKLQGKIQKENEYRAKSLEDYKWSLNEQLGNINKRIDALPTFAILDELIEEMKAKLKEKLITEVRDTLLNPEIYMMSQRLRLVNSDLENDIELANKKIITETKILEEKIEKINFILNGNNTEIEKKIESNGNALKNEIKKIKDFDEHLKSLVYSQDQQISKLCTALGEKIKKIKASIKEWQNKLEEVKNSIPQVQIMPSPIPLSSIQNIPGVEISSYSPTVSWQQNTFNQKENQEQMAQETKPFQEFQPAQQYQDEAFSPKSLSFKPSQDSILDFQIPVHPTFNIPIEEITEKLKDEIREEISELKIEIYEHIKAHDDKLAKDITDTVKPIENRINNTKGVLENYVKELRDKLAWLPISLNQLEGMNPTEARIFTLEARLRSEENSRIQGFNQILKVLDHSKAQLPPSSRASPEPTHRREVSTPQIPSGRVSTRPRSKIYERRATPGGMCTSDMWKKPSEHKKSLNESDSIHGSKIATHSPLENFLSDDSNAEIFHRYQAHRKFKEIPKSWDLDTFSAQKGMSPVPSKDEITLRSKLSN
ncbi:unnamed protein product [Blepharisma stoltei]|uniref:Uncharacterized protein n=1 Tax=Blepharisma stoltei TaxID=1481888 RepID=A0AAU9IU72_9CILI|nr:unnamed protein product [Blepharisma stoltei]